MDSTALGQDESGGRRPMCEAGYRAEAGEAEQKRTRSAVRKRS